MSPAAPRPGGGSGPRAGVTQLRVGRLTKAHGLKGALKIELYTDDPDRRFAPGSSFSLHGKTLELVELRWYNAQPVGFFVGVDDRTAAETLVKAILWVDQETAELPEEKDAWYDHQLVGLKAFRDGVEIGRVVRVDHFPAQDLLAIRTAEREVLVPFVAAIVPEVDVAAGRITLTPPAGLFEDLPDEPEPAASPTCSQSTGAADSEAKPDAQPDDAE